MANETWAAFMTKRLEIDALADAGVGIDVKRLDREEWLAALLVMASVFEFWALSSLWWPFRSGRGRSDEEALSRWENEGGSHG